MRRVLLAIGIVLVAGVAGAYVLVVRPLLAPAEPTPIVEEAVATPDLVLLAGINVKQAAFVERWLLGAPVTTVAHEAPARVAADRTLLDHLRAANVDPRRDLDYVLYALYRTDDASVHHALVLVGRFDPGRIEDYVARELGGVPRAIGGRTSHEITMISPLDCKPTHTWMVTADRRWIVIGDPATHAVVFPRVAGRARGESDRVGWWRSLARRDLVSVGLWGLKDADRAVPSPLAQGMAKGLAAQTDAFAHVYFGLGVRTVPPEGRLRLVLDAADAGAAADKIARWQRALGESKAQWAQTVPTVAALYDSLTVRSQGSRSTLEFTVDRALAGNLRGVANELLGAVLAGFGVRRSFAETPRAERIDTSPLVFQATTSPPALGAYDPAAQFAEDVDQIQGPFGLRLGEVRLGSSPDVGLELVVEGFAGALPNVTDESRRARLFVDSVKSTAGEEWLRREACGRERNDEPAAFTTSMARLRASKAARLIAGADPHALGSVSGHVDLRLPIRTETVTIARAPSGMKAERNGATFVVTSMTGGTVGYQIGGARDNVLHFHALNTAGQPLASQGGFSADFILGDGVAGQKEYAGVVDRVEVVFATEEQALRSPFTLSDFSFAGKAPAASRDTTPPFQPYGYQAFRRDRPRLAGPGKPGVLAAAPLEAFELSLDKLTSYFGTALEFTFRSPTVPDFERAFTVGRLRLTRIELKDGTALEPPAAGAPAKAMTVGPVWETPIRFGSAPKDGVLTTTLRLLLDAKLNPEDLKALRGVVTVQFPRRLETLRLDDLTPGQRAALGDFAVTVAAHGRKGLTLVANKDGQRLLYTRIVAADGQPIAFFGPQISMTPGGAWRFELSPRGAPVAAEAIVARELDRKDYPFTLVPR